MTTVKVTDVAYFSPDGHIFTILSQRQHFIVLLILYMYNGTFSDSEKFFEPHFTNHGFRYVQLDGFPGIPKLHGTIYGQVVHTDVKKAGNIFFEAEMLNQIQHSIWEIMGDYKLKNGGKR